MKDFDVIRAERVNADRSFRIGGITFTYKPSVSADLLADYFDATFSVEGTNADVVAKADALVLGWLEPGQEDAWRAVRSASAESPLSMRDIQEIITHMTEILAGRPTESASDSSSTSERTGTTSVEQSPSPVAA